MGKTTESIQATLRNELRQQREALGQGEISARSARICRQITDHQSLNNAQHIAIYLPFRGEADPTGLMSSSDAQFYLPILNQNGSNTLLFAPYDQNTTMWTNRFGISEPVLDDLVLLDDPRQLDIVIMPMVGVDSQGNRIGMGGGFYDRTFAHKHSRPESTPELIAFAYNFQLLPEVDANPWDVPADYIATESNFISNR